MKDSFNSKKDEETIKKGRPFERRFPLANNATIFQVLSLHNFDVTPSDLPYIRRLIMSLVRHINMAKCAREQRLLQYFNLWDQPFIFQLFYLFIFVFLTIWMEAWSPNWIASTRKSLKGFRCSLKLTFTRFHLGCARYAVPWRRVKLLITVKFRKRISF